VLAVAAAGRVRFDIGAGFTVPVQVVFVPMLFALPVSIVPLLVCFALVFGMAIDVVRGCAPADRMLLEPGNSWFALGPALVLVGGSVKGPHAAAGLLLGALAAQFVADFVSNAIRERLRKGITIRELADEMRNVYLIDVCLTPVGLAIAFAAEGRAWSVLLILPLFVVLGVFSHERRRRLEQLVELNDAYRGTALVLGNVVEADDQYTGEHCRDVLRLALDVASELRLDAHRRRNVEFAALLHDVGKIVVPNEIINKTGPLDDREWAIMKTHTVEGQRMLDEVGGFMREVGQIVRSSHERWTARLSRRPRGQGHPARVAHRLRLRRLQRDDDHALLPRRDVARDRGRRAPRQRRDAVRPMVVDALMRMIGREAAEAADESLAPSGYDQLPEPVAGALLSADGRRVRAMRLVTFRDPGGTVHVGELVRRAGARAARPDDALLADRRGREPAGASTSSPTWRSSPPCPSRRACATSTPSRGHVAAGWRRRGAEIPPACTRRPPSTSRTPPRFWARRGRRAPRGDRDARLRARDRRGGRRRGRDRGLHLMNDWSARDVQREEMTVGLGPRRARTSRRASAPGW